MFPHSPVHNVPPPPFLLSPLPLCPPHLYEPYFPLQPPFPPQLLPHPAWAAPLHPALPGPSVTQLPPPGTTPPFPPPSNLYTPCPCSLRNPATYPSLPLPLPNSTPPFLPPAKVYTPCFCSLGCAVPNLPPPFRGTRPPLPPPANFCTPCSCPLCPPTPYLNPPQSPPSPTPSIFPPPWGSPIRSYHPSSIPQFPLSPVSRPRILSCIYHSTSFRCPLCPPTFSPPASQPSHYPLPGSRQLDYPLPFAPSSLFPTLPFPPGSTCPPPPPVEFCPALPTSGPPPVPTPCSPTATPPPPPHLHYSPPTLPLSIGPQPAPPLGPNPLQLSGPLYPLFHPLRTAFPTLFPFPQANPPHPGLCQGVPSPFDALLSQPQQLTPPPPGMLPLGELAADTAREGVSEFVCEGAAEATEDGAAKAAREGAMGVVGEGAAEAAEERAAEAAREGAAAAARERAAGAAREGAAGTVTLARQRAEAMETGFAGVGATEPAAVSAGGTAAEEAIGTAPGEAAQTTAGVAAGITTGEAAGGTMAGEAAGSAVGEAAGSAAGEAVGGAAGEAAESAAGEAAGSAASEAAGSAAGEAAGSAAGGTAGATAGEAAADAAGEAARAASCKVGQTLAGEAAQSTAGEVAWTATGEAAGTAAGEAAGTTADEAAGGTMAGEAAGSAAGEAEIAAAGEAAEAAACEVEQILAGEAAQTAAGEAAGTAAGEAAGTAAREAAGTAAREATGIAAGEAEQITVGEVLQTAAVEAARTAAGATEATAGAGIGGGATGAAGKGVTGTGARESAAPAVAREGTAGASKAEGEAAAEAAGRAIARPVGAAGAAANSGKHTAGPAGPAETAKGASSKAAAGGVGLGDIGATGEGEGRVVPTGVGTEEGDVIAIEEDEGEDVMHIDGPLAQYLTLDGEADPAPLQPHVEVPPLPPMPVPMLAEGPMEGLGETLRTEPREGAPILTSRPPAHPPPGAPLPHPHPQVPVVSRGAAKALAFLAEPCSPTPTLLHGQPPSPSPTPDPTVAGGPPGEHAAETHPQGLAPQAHGSGGTRARTTRLAAGGRTGAEEAEGPTSTARPPNLHSRPAPAPPQGHGSGPAHSPPFCPSRAVSPSQVAAAAIATGRGAVGLRDAPMADATDSPSHPSHPFHVDDPLPQPMVIGEGQGGLLGQGPHPSSAQPARPTPPSTLPALLLSPTGRQVFETPEEVRAGISDLLAIHRLSSSPAAPTLPVPQDRTRTYAEVTRSVPSFIPPATQPGASLPTPMETDRGLRPCHSHLDGVAPPPVQPVAQEVTSSRDEASAPTETPPPGVAEPSLEPHPAEGQEHTTAHTSGSPPRPPSPASTPVPARGPALSCATPPLSSLTPPPRGAGESSPPLIPGDPVGAQAAHGVPSTASSDATAPIDPADTATSPDQVVSCPTCRSSLANRRALQHHIPFCHPADAARRAQAAHDTASIIPSLSQPRATGMQFTDAQWQTLDSVDWTEYFSPERIHTRPLRRVPERVRGGYLDVLSAILVRIAQDPEAAGPTFLLAAAPTLFLVPATPPDRSHTAAIATRISRFGRGEWAELVSDALGRRTPLPRRTGHRSRTATDPSAADERRIARCLRLAACNETSRACAALESAEAAPDTQGTIQRLQSKHPNAERPTPAWLSGFQGSPLVLSVDHLRRAIFTAPRGSSGGPSGWVAEHLRDTFLAFPQSLHFLLAVYQQWLRGRCAPAARSLLASSTLVALAKSNMDVRPIAIGEVLVRILSRAVCLQLRDQMARVFLASQQFGVGVTCGTEVVVRGVRRALADHPDWVVLQLDVANAFNSFHRDRMFQALQASPEFQCLIPFIGLFYGTPSDLHYRSGTGVVTMHSERGTRQGDPLSPFLYALTQRLALEPVLAEGDVQLWSYADDTYVLGPPDRVLHHFAEIVRRLGEMGLAAQPHKCLVYQTESFLSRDLEAFTGLGIEVARRGLTVTGVPVGTVSFVEQSLPDRLERMGRVLPWLPRLRQPQTAARLLSACVSTRPQYLSRTVPPSPAVISSFTRWDARLGETFQQLLASGTWACREDVREAALDQIFLPIRLGGFGIRRMARIAPVSFVCSWVQCAPILCSLPACGEVFRQSFASGEPEQIDRALQTALEGLPPDVLSLLPPWPSCASASPDSLFAGASRLLEAHALEAVRARHTSPLHLARLTSLQGGGAGAWLTSVPYADPLRIPEALWQAASSSRLGLPIPQLALAGQCSCGQAIDDMTVPHHAVRCPRYGVATTIHDTVKYMLRDFAVEAGFAVKVEDSTLFTQLEAARARLLGQPVVGEGTRAEGPGERRGEAGQPGGGGQWGRHQLRGQVERGTGGQRGRQGEQTGQDGEGGRHRQQQESQWRPRAQGAAPPGSASGAGQGREQQRADGGTGGAAGLGGEGQGVREAAGDGAGGSGGLGEGREGEGRGQVDGGEERGRETIGEGAPRDQTGQQPAQQQGPVGRTGRVGTASRIPDLTCRDVGQGLMVLVDVSIADPQREGNVQLRRATPTQIGVAAARRVQEKLRHWGPHLEGLQPAPHFYACVAETFGLLSEPLRQFLGLCAKRIAQRRRDRGGGDDGSARIFEAGLTTRLSVALQRAQAQCMIQHAVRQLGSHTPCPLMPSAPPAPTLRVPAPLPPLLTLPAPPRRFPPPAIRSSPPVRSPPLPSPPPSPPLLHASSFPSPTHSTPCPSSIRTLPLVSRPPMLGFSPPCPSPPFPAPHLPPLPAPPTLPPPLSLASYLPASPFPPPCAQLLPSLPLPPPRPAPHFPPPPPPTPGFSPPRASLSFSVPLLCSLPAPACPCPCLWLLPSLPHPLPVAAPPLAPSTPLPPVHPKSHPTAPTLPRLPVSALHPRDRVRLPTAQRCHTPCPLMPSAPPAPTLRVPAPLPPLLTLPAPPRRFPPPAIRSSPPVRSPPLPSPPPSPPLLHASSFPSPTHSTPCPSSIRTLPLVSRPPMLGFSPPCPSPPFPAPHLPPLPAPPTLPPPCPWLPTSLPHLSPLRVLSFSPPCPSLLPALPLIFRPPPPPRPVSPLPAPPFLSPCLSFAPSLPPPAHAPVFGFSPPCPTFLPSLPPVCPSLVFPSPIASLLPALDFPHPCPRFLSSMPLVSPLCTPIQPPPPSPGCPFPLSTPATVCGFQPPNGGAHGAFLRMGKPPRGPPTPLVTPPAPSCHPLPPAPTLRVPAPLPPLLTLPAPPRRFPPPAIRSSPPVRSPPLPSPPPSPPLLHASSFPSPTHSTPCPSSIRTLPLVSRPPMLGFSPPCPSPPFPAPHLPPLPAPPHSPPPLVLGFLPPCLTFPPSVCSASPLPAPPSSPPCPSFSAPPPPTPGFSPPRASLSFSVPLLCSLPAPACPCPCLWLLPSLPHPLPVAAPPLAPSTPLPPVHPKSHPTAPTLPRLPVSALHPRDRVRLPTAQRWPFSPQPPVSLPLVPPRSARASPLPTSYHLPLLPPPRLLPIITRMFPHSPVHNVPPPPFLLSPLPLCPPHLYEPYFPLQPPFPPQLLPHPAWAAPLHPALPGPSVTQLPPPGTTPPFPPPSNLYTPCPCSLRNPATYPSLPLPLPNSTPPFLPPAKVYTPCFCSLGCAVPNLPPPFRGTRPPLPPPANFCTPCSCPLCPPTPYLNPPQSPPSPTPSIFPPPWGSPIRSYHPSSIPQFPLSPVSRPRILSCIYHSTSFRCPLCPPTFSPPASQPSHYPLPGSRQLDYPLPFAPSSLFPTLPFPPGSTCPPPPPVEFCPALPTSGPPPVPTPCSPTATPPPPPHLHYSPPTLPLSIGPQPAPPLGPNPLQLSGPLYPLFHPLRTAFPTLFPFPQANPPHPGLCQGVPSPFDALLSQPQQLTPPPPGMLPLGELAADTAREGVSEFVCEGAAEATEDGAAKAAREGAMGVVGEGAAEAAEERAAEAAREGAAAAARERAAGAAREGAAGTVTLARQRAEAMETGFAGVGATEPAAVSAGGTAAEEAIGTAPGEAAQTTAGVAAGITTGEAAGGTMAGEAAGSAVGEAAGSAAGEAVGGAAGEAAESAAGEAAGSAASEAAGSAAGEAAGSAAGGTAGATAGEAAADAAGEAARAASCKVGQTLAGEAAQSTAGEVAWTATGEAAGTAAGEAAGTTADEAAGGTMAGEAAGSAAGEAEIAAAGEAAEAAACEVEQILAGEAAQTAAGEAAGTAAGEAAGTAAREAAGTAAREATGIAAGEAEQITVGEVLQTAAVEAARTAAGATEATAGAGIGGGATGAAGKGVTGTGARESAAPAVAREGTAGASKAEGEAAAEAAGRAIARPVGAAGAAANSGKHTAGPAGPAETAKGASSKAAAGGVGLGDIGATGEGEGRVVPTGVGTEEGDVIAIEEDEGEDPHVEVPPLPPMPVPMLAEGPMEGLGETLRTEPREGAPILTSRPPAHPPPGAPLPHPHPQVPVVSRGAAKALAFLAEPCSPTPTLLHGQPPSPSPTPDPTVAGGPPGEHAAETHPQGLAPQAHGSGGTRARTTRLAAGGRTGAEEAEGPTSTARPPNLHSRPAPAPPQGHGSGPAHSPPFCPSRAVSPSQVAAAAIATGRGAVGLRDAPMADATDSPSHPSHPFHVDDPLPQPMVIGEGQGGLLGQGPHPSSAQPARPTPPSTLPALLLSPTGRQVFETPEEVRAGISDLLAIHRLSSSPAAPTLPVPQDRTRTYAEVTRSVPSFIPPATQPGASLPTPMETDRGLRPCHSHLDGVAPPPVQPVAQEVTSSRDEASAPTETPPPGVAEPSLEPHPAEGQEHTTAHTSGSPPRPPSPASTPVPARGPALSCATPPLSSLTPPPRGAGESSPPLIPGDPVGAQAAHGVPSTASSDATAPIDPADTATSPDQVVSCPTCRSSLANRRALQHHIPFCHPADAARRAQAAHDTASIIPSLSQPRATGMQFTDAQWQTLDSVDWTEYFSPERIHTRPLRRVPERVRGGYLDVLSAILVRIAQDPEAAGPTFLLAAAPTLFLVPATPPDRSHTAAIATRISRFGRGEWAELVSDALGRRTPLPRRTGHRSRTATDPSAADERRIARCLRLAACNETSRAVRGSRVRGGSPRYTGDDTAPAVEAPQRGEADPSLAVWLPGVPSRALEASAALWLTTPDWVVLQLDVANAFNSFHRDRMFQALQASPEFQCLIPFIGLFYGTPSDLHYRSGTGVVTMHSERGTRQGDPLSPFLYALTQRLALEPVLAEGDVQLWSYADDTYVLGPPDRVLHHFAEIVRRLGEMGLAAQPHKCLVYQTESFLSRDLEAFTGLGIEVARRGLTVTGVPVGTVSFVEQSLPDRLERMGRVLPWLPRLRQPQTAARLLSACVSTRPQYLSRTGPGLVAEDVREAALDQIFLPIRLGGFGIRRMARIAPSFASGELEQIDRALQTALEGASRLLEAHALEAVRARHTSPLHLARLTSLQGGGAGAWLTSVPYADPLRIPEALWQAASSSRLGLPIPQLALAVVGEGTRAEGPGERRGEAGQPGGGGQWGRHQLRGQVERGTGGQRGRQGEQTGQDGEGGRHRQQQESQWRPRAQGAAPPGSASGAGQGREQQRADGGTGGAAGLGGEGQGVREAAGDGAGGSGGLGEGREGEGRGQVDGGEERGRETIGEGAPRDQTGQQPAQQQGPVGRTGRVGTASRIPDLTCRDVGQSHPLPPHAIRSPRPYPPRARSLAASFDPPCPPSPFPTARHSLLPARALPSFTFSSPLPSSAARLFLPLADPLHSLPLLNPHPAPRISPPYAWFLPSLPLAAFPRSPPPPSPCPPHSPPPLVLGFLPPCLTFPPSVCSASPLPAPPSSPPCPSFSAPPPPRPVSPLPAPPFLSPCLSFAPSLPPPAHAPVFGFSPPCPTFLPSLPPVCPSLVFPSPIASLLPALDFPHPCPRFLSSMPLPLPVAAPPLAPSTPLPPVHPKSHPTAPTLPRLPVSALHPATVCGFQPPNGGAHGAFLRMASLPGGPPPRWVVVWAKKRKEKNRTR
ncbi:unnamed protein product [Closterium sp. NIES-64]|nr:unnamed protein product [Closterium sp. NIES-64]